MVIFVILIIVVLGLYFMYKQVSKNSYSSDSEMPYQNSVQRPSVNLVIKENGKTIDYTLKEPMGDADEWIEEFKNLTKGEARKKYFELRDAGIYLPDKAYVYLMKKRNGEIYFNDEEYKKRESQGKQTSFIYDIDLFAEQAIELWSDPNIDYEKKVKEFDLLSKQYKVRNKTDNYLQIYKQLVDKLILNKLSSDNADFIKSERRRLAIAITKGKITFRNIPFQNIDKLFKDQEPMLIQFVEGKNEKRN